MSTTRQPNKTSRPHILVIGGALSGPAAAARARETNERAKITLLERNVAISYPVGGLTAHVSGDVRDAKRLNQQGPNYFRRRYKIDARTGVEVTGIDAGRHTVQTTAGKIRYDKLIFALGVESIVPRIEGTQGAENVHVLRNLVDLRRVMQVFEGRRNPRVAVVGGGYFGLEAADAFSRAKAQVTVIEHNPTLLPEFFPEVGALARAALLQTGTQLYLGDSVISANQNRNRVRLLHTSLGQKVPVDLVLMTAGVSPRTQLLRAAGAEAGSDGSIVIDENCRTSLVNVYACGVCVKPPNQSWNPQAGIADITAQVAGAHAAGGDATLRHFTGASILGIGEWAFARGGYGADVCHSDGTGSVLVQGPARDSFLDANRPLNVRLVYERKGGTVVGWEVFGQNPNEVKRRADILATALAAKLSVSALAQLDLPYSAPFSTVRDVVSVAGYVAATVQAQNIIAWSPGVGSRSAQEPLHFIDVREKASRGRRSEKLTHMPFSTVRDQVRKLPKKGTLIFVSDDGRDGFLAAQIARQRGFENVGFLAGGLSVHPNF